MKTTHTNQAPTVWQFLAALIIMGIVAAILLKALDGMLESLTMAPLRHPDRFEQIR